MFYSTKSFISGESLDKCLAISNHDKVGNMGLLLDTLNCGLRMRRESRVSEPDMHHDTCVPHEPWCMPGPLNSGSLWSRWRGKRKRPMRAFGFQCCEIPFTQFLFFVFPFRSQLGDFALIARYFGLHVGHWTTLICCRWTQPLGFIFRLRTSKWHKTNNSDFTWA